MSGHGGFSGMGGGSRSGGGGLGNGVTRIDRDKKGVGSITDSAGEVIDLRGNPLYYGKNDPTIQGKQRKVAEKFEKQHYKDPYENASTIDASGNETQILGNFKNNKHSIQIPVSKVNAASVITHNHPSLPGELGGTLSDADIREVIYSSFSPHSPEYKTMRADAEEGTYSLSVKKNYTDSFVVHAYDKAGSEYRKQYEKQMAQIQRQYDYGKISASDAKAKAKKAWNKYLVKCHNWLSDNQERYGYLYTLERRR